MSQSSPRSSTYFSSKAPAKSCIATTATRKRKKKRTMRKGKTVEKARPILSSSWRNSETERASLKTRSRRKIFITVKSSAHAPVSGSTDCSAISSKKKSTVSASIWLSSSRMYARGPCAKSLNPTSTVKIEPKAMFSCSSSFCSCSRS